MVEERDTSGSPGRTPWQRARAVVGQALPLAAILLLAVELRLIFSSGLVQLDSLSYVHLARNLADGASTGSPLSPWTTARIGLYGPVAILYWLFGVSDVTSLAWPFGCSLFGILCAYGVGRILDGEGAGLLAAFLWTILPTNVAAATALLGDGPIAALSIAVVFFVLVAESVQGLKRVAAIAAAVTCFVVGFLNKPLFGLLLLFLALHLLWTRRKSRVVWVALPAIVVVAAVGYAYYFRQLGITRAAWSGVGPLARDLARTSTDWWTQVVTGHPEFFWISPLWIVAASVLLAVRRRQAYLPLLWFASIFLYLELGSSSPLAYVPMMAPSEWAARHFLLVAAPAAIVTGMYLAMGMTQTTARRLTLLAAAVTGVIAFAGTRHATHLAWGTTGEGPFDLPFSVISPVMTAFVIFGGISSPAFLTGALTRWKSAMLAFLLVGIGIAALGPTYRAASEHRGPWVTTITEAAQFLETAPSLPILVQNEVFGERLDYASGFRLGFNSAYRRTTRPVRIQLAPNDADSVREAYILVDEFYLTPGAALEWGNGPGYFRSPPARWAEVARFGNRDGYRLRVYRVSSVLSAADLAAAQAAVRAARTPGTLRQLMVAAAGAGEDCLAAAAWQQRQPLAPDSPGDLPPIAALRGCYEQRPDVAGANLFKNGDFRHGFDNWGISPDANATRSLELDPTTGAGTAHVSFKGGNWAVLMHALTLKPDAAYVYRMRVRSTAPIVALYWQADVSFLLDQNRAYPEWTDLVFVFVTPHWGGQSKEAIASPVLPRAAGDVWVADVQLRPFTFDQQSVDSQFPSGRR
jgi:hypothetical protein